MINGGTHQHHNGLLAGASAGAVAILVAGVLVLVLPGVRHQAGEALVVAAWAATAAVVIVVAAGAVFAVLWLRHKASALRPGVPAPVAASVMTAEVVSSVPAELPPPDRRAIAPHVTLHLPEGISAEAAAALARALGSGEPA